MYIIYIYIYICMCVYKSLMLFNAVFFLIKYTKTVMLLIYYYNLNCFVPM